MIGLIPTSRKRLSQKKPIGQLWLSHLREQGCLSVIAITALLAPFVPAPAANVRWHGAQTLGVELGAVVLLMLLLHRLLSTRNWPKVALMLPLVTLCILLLWGLFSWIRSGEDSFATQGLLLLASGVVVTNVIVYQARTEQNYLLLTDALIAVGFLVAFSGIALYGSDSTPLIVGVLHDHMLFGAFVMFLIPITLAVILAPVTAARRLFAQATLIACVTAMLMAQTRSSWIGGAAALLTFGGLLVSVRRAAPQQSYNPHKWSQLVQGGLISTLIILSLGCFLWLSPERETLYARARTLTTTVVRGKDNSTEWRFTAWAGAKAMIQQKPLIGWGIGNYPRYQYSFTHMGHPADVVARKGPTILDETHNLYLQLWVEIGFIGLALWLVFLASFFVITVSSLRSLAAGSLEQRIAIGGVSAVLGQTLDAFANPAWQFGHIILPFWIIVGLTISIVRGGKAVSTPLTVSSNAPISIGRFAKLMQLIIVLTVAGVLLWSIVKTAPALPVPHL